MWCLVDRILLNSYGFLFVDNMLVFVIGIVCDRESVCNLFYQVLKYELRTREICQVSFLLLGMYILWFTILKNIVCDALVRFLKSIFVSILTLLKTTNQGSDFSINLWFIFQQLVFIYLIRDSWNWTCYFENSIFRFEEWNSETSDAQYFPLKIALYTMVKRRISTCASAVRKGLQRSFECIQILGKPYVSFSSNDNASENLSSKKEILDPQDPFLQRWNKIFVLACVIAVSADPLFFYIPIINQEKCLDLDIKLENTANVLRSFMDIFYLLHIIFQFRTGFIAPSSRVFGRGVLVEDSWAIAKKYLYSYFFVDILSVLPLPQV